MLVFHWNRRLRHYKCVCLGGLLLYLIFLYTFEAIYHFFTICPDDPIDVVYTWVNGSDPKFLKKLKFYTKKYQTWIDHSRYDDKFELLFSLRSLEKYAPWVRRIFIVTNGQIPYWLNLDYEKVVLITHKEIFVDSYNLPSFSSPAIEMHLHRIPNLSKRFIYLNDDIFLQSPLYKDDFLSPSRGFLIYLSWLLPPCSPECSWLYVADGNCDSVCNNSNCQMDGGDCDDNTSKPSQGDVIFDVTEKIEKTLHTQQKINVSEVIKQHNKKVIFFDKLKRKKGRRLSIKQTDAYTASLQHTNRILNKFYGFSVRKVPAHAPILIDRDVMEEMQKKFQKYFDVTARNRIRSADDVQFGFLYYYYVIHEKSVVNIEELFDQFDTDQSGIWSERELRTVITKLYDLPLIEESFHHFASILMNCSNSDPEITKEFVKNCGPLSSVLNMQLGIRHKYKYDLVKDADKKYVSFKMLNSNLTDVINQLDDVRKNTKKFVCLNDNLDQTQTSNNEIIKRLMFDFYMSLFPVSSKFELPQQYKNRFSHIEDYISLMEKKQQKFLLALLLTIVILILLVFNLFRKKIIKVIKNIVLV